jgi:hypothetical protein
MITFHVVVDAQISADDIDDALLQLARHFDKVHSGEDSDLLLPGSTVTVQPSV